MKTIANRKRTKAKKPAQKMTPAESGARGGAAACGDKKRREMTGAKPGRASAGRVDAGPKRELEERKMRMAVGPLQVWDQACREFWQKRGVVLGGYGPFARA